MSDSTEVHFEGKIAQKAIIVKENKVLLIRDPRIAEVIWELPGGRMNINEEPRMALVREIKEELGIEVKVGEVVFMQQFMQGNEGKRAFVIVYIAILVDTQAEFELDAREVCEFAWVSAAELEKFPLFSEYKNALDCYFEKYAN